MNIYSEAPDVSLMGYELVLKHHPDLVNTKVVFCFMSQVDEEGNTEPIMKRGKVHWGDARRISGLNAHLAGEANPFFCIEISLHAWENMTLLQKTALVDHELCHCAVEDDKLALRPHDIEEFGCIVARYGLWKNDVMDFARIVEDQLKLNFEEAQAGNDTTVTVTVPGERSVTVTDKRLARAAKAVNGKARRTDKQVVEVFENALADRGLIPPKKGRGRRKVDLQPEAA